MFSRSQRLVTLSRVSHAACRALFACGGALAQRLERLAVGSECLPVLVAHRAYALDDDLLAWAERQRTAQARKGVGWAVQSLERACATHMHLHSRLVVLQRALAVILGLATAPCLQVCRGPVGEEHRRHFPVDAVQKVEFDRARVVCHRFGVPTLLDWVSDGSIILVELRRLMARETEFTEAVKRLGDLIEGDMGGKMVMLTDERLLLLPPGIDTGGS